MRSGAEVSRVSRLKSWIQALGMVRCAAKSWVKRICRAPEKRSAWIAGRGRSWQPTPEEVLSMVSRCSTGQSDRGVQYLIC